MPNLILSIDPSQFYDPDITRFYPFEDTKINIQENLRLLKAAAIVNNEDSILFLIVDSDDNHMSILRLVKVLINQSEYFQIKKSFSPVSNKGYGYLLYCLVLENHIGDIISDSFNTLPGSYNVWMKILKNDVYNVQLLNLQNGKKNKIAKPIDDLKIWGVESDYLEEIDQTSWDTSVFEDEFIPEGEDDFYEEEYYVNYLSENDKYERNMVSDFVVRALKKGSNKIKDRKNNVLLVNQSS